MIAIDTVDELQNYWRDYKLQWWAGGMPSYCSKNTEPWKQVRVKFRTQADRDHFAEATGYRLTVKTNSVWYPDREPEKNAMNRYVGD